MMLGPSPFPSIHAATRRAQEVRDQMVAEHEKEAQARAAILSSGGHKDDSNKARMDLIPSEAMFALAAVLTFGANKYADRNWEKGIKWGRVFGALNRHLWAWWAGKGPTSKSFLFGELDPETKFSHLWHALCCVVFLVTYEERGMTSFDDRFTGEEISK